MAAGGNGVEHLIDLAPVIDALCGNDVTDGEVGPFHRVGERAFCGRQLASVIGREGEETLEGVGNGGWSALELRPFSISRVRGRGRKSGNRQCRRECA